VTALWAPSAASEISKLTTEEAIQFSQRVVDRSKGKNVHLVASVHRSSDWQKYAVDIIATYKTGVSTIVIDLASLALSTDTEETLLSNLNTLLSLIGDIPIGIYEAKEPYHRTISANLLRSIINSRKVFFLIDTSGSTVSLQNKLDAVDAHHSGFKIFNGNVTTFLHSLEMGISGYAGEAATFMPKIFAWIWRYYKKDKANVKGVHAFLSMSELTMRSLFPLNLKIYLKLHQNLSKLDGVTRIDMPKDLLEETILRVTHLHEAATFVEHELETTFN